METAVILNSREKNEFAQQTNSQLYSVAVNARKSDRVIMQFLDHVTKYTNDELTDGDSLEQCQLSASIKRQ